MLNAPFDLKIFFNTMSKDLTIDSTISGRSWRELGYRSPSQFERRPNDESPFSSENPYYKQMVYESDRSFRRALQQQAQDWEASNQQYELSRSYALADRAHEEEYNSPLHQAILQQQAGGVGAYSSASGSSSGSFFPTDSDAPGIPTPVSQNIQNETDSDKSLRNAGSIFDITGDATNIALNCLAFASGVSTFGTNVQQSKSNLSATNLSNQAQSLVNENLPADISNRNLLNDYELSAGYFNRALSDARTLVSRVDADGNPIPVTEDDYSTYSSNVPERYRTGYLDRMRSFVNNPDLLAGAYENARSFRRQSAFHNYEGRIGFLSSYVDSFYRAEVSRLRLEESSNNLNYSLNQALEVLGYPEQKAASTVASAEAESSDAGYRVETNRARIENDIPNLDASTDASRLKYSQKIITDAINSFDKSLEGLVKYRLDIDSRISQIESKSTLNSQDEVTLSALKMARLQIDAYGNHQISNTFSVLRSFYKDYHQYKSTRSMEATGRGYEFSPTGPAGIPNMSDTLNPDKRWVDYTFGDYCNDYSSGAGKFVEKAIKI